jgi:hypothetical protein
MNPPRIKFSHPVGVLAVIEGTVKREGELLMFELAMTESVTGPVKSVIKRQLYLSELESVRLKRRIFRKSRLELTSRSLQTFKTFPGSMGFTFSVLVEEPHKYAVSFVRDVLFEMTQIEMEALSKRFPDVQTVNTAATFEGIQDNAEQAVTPNA